LVQLIGANKNEVKKKKINVVSSEQGFKKGWEK
jgi:hypothetical protein